MESAHREEIPARRVTSDRAVRRKPRALAAGAAPYGNSEGGGGWIGLAIGLSWVPMDVEGPWNTVGLTAHARCGRAERDAIGHLRTLGVRVPEHTLGSTSRRSNQDVSSNTF